MKISRFVVDKQCSSSSFLFSFQYFLIDIATKYRFKFLIELISNPQTSIDQQYRANDMALMFSGVSIPLTAETPPQKNVV